MEVRRTGAFTDWFAGLRDRKARDRILARICRLSLGNPGRREAGGEGRIGTADRLRSRLPAVFRPAGRTVGILLCGGDESTPAADIKRAIEMAREV